MAKYPTQLTPAILAYCRQVFNRVDTDAKGYLTRSEIKVAITGVLGYKPSKFEVAYIVRDVNIDQGEMTLDTFISHITPKLHLHSIASNASPTSLSSIRAHFLLADRHSKGYLTLPDLQSVFHSVAPHVSQPVIQRAFETVDRQGTGRIGYREFERIMTVA
ncbi:hypothetical protein DFS34DRAFT_609301 [Phlyctochytrium arcticum]|nr:hypothetical protein DFS34DRAFT_609301 [Phlyctochytrium arcticum]